MKFRQPSYYSAFQCIGSACSDNCCIGWEIDIDENTFQGYKQIPGEFGRRLRDSIAREAAPHFLLDKAERCPMLNKDNLCDIILNLGKDRLCEICAQHPRFHNWLGPIRESGLGLCCEAAGLLIFQEPSPVSFCCFEEGQPVERAEDPFFHLLLQGREWIFSILQDRRRTIGRRLALSLALSERLQQAADEGASLPSRPWEEFISPSQSFWTGFPGGTGEEAFSRQISSLRRLLDFCLGLEPLSPQWPAKLKEIQTRLPRLWQKRSLFLSQYQRPYEYEHFIVYLVYRYFVQAFYDGDLLSKMKFAAAGYLLLQLLDLHRWDTCGHSFSLRDRILTAKEFSKEIEYSQENLDAFWEESWTNPLFHSSSLAELSLL